MTDHHDMAGGVDTLAFDDRTRDRGRGPRLMIQAFLAVSAALLLLVLSSPLCRLLARCSGSWWRPISGEDGILMELTGPTIEVRERRGGVAGNAVAPVARRVRRRDEFEAVSLLLAVSYTH